MRGSLTIMGLFMGCGAALALVACVPDLKDGTGGGSSSGPTTTSANSTGATSSSGSGTNPCVLDSSKLDECTLQ